VAARTLVAESILARPPCAAREESSMTTRNREIGGLAHRSEIIISWTIAACLLLGLLPSPARAAPAPAATNASTDAAYEPPPAENAAATSPTPTGPVRTKLIELTFVPSHVRSTDGSDAAGQAKTAGGTDLTTPGEDGVEKLVSAFTDLYGKNAAKLVRGGVLLHGDSRQLGDMTRTLDRFDQPYPQVQLNMWAVQISGSPDKVGCELRRASKLIGATRDNLVAVKHKLVELVALKDSNSLCVGAKTQKNLENVAKHLVPDFPFDEPMSFSEALILLIARPDRQEKIAELESFALSQQVATVEGCRAQDSAASEERLKTAFQRLKAALPTRTVPAHCDRLVEFLENYQAVQDDENAYEKRGMAGVQEAALVAQVAYTNERSDALALRLRSSRLDSLLHAVTDAFVSDVEELFFAPLLAQLTAGQNPHGDGVSLVGRSRLVVTSGIESDLDAEMASYAETTRPKPFGKDLIDALFPSGGDSTSGAGAVAKSATTAAVPEAKLGQVAAIVLSEPEPRYSKVAPGIAVHVRPTVLADGSAARLKIDARFGVAISDYNPAQQKYDDQWVQPPPPGISAHRVLTDAAVSAFDLFDISSFSVDTVVPRSPFVVPVLGRLPFIGHIFEFPRKNQATRHESIVLVNTVILPRAMALASFYVGGKENPPPEKGAKPRVAAVH
jgi:hypothetical protein